MSFPCAVEIETTRHDIAQAESDRATEADVESAEALANKWNCPFCDEFGTAVVEAKSMFDDEWLVRCDDCGGQTGYEYSPRSAVEKWVNTFKRRMK